MTDQAALERLLNQRDGVPPIDDRPIDTSDGDIPAGPDDIDEED